MSDEVLARAHALIEAGDSPAALERCREALVATPDDLPVAKLAVQLLMGARQLPQAFELCQDLGAAVPEAMWPWTLAVDPLEAALVDHPEQAAKLKAFQAKPGEDLWAAMQVFRGALATASWWPQLVRQIHLMSQRTWRIRDQVELHDELVNVLAVKLSDPLAARDAREAAEEWKDVPTLVARYWGALEQHSDDPAAWDEAEAFFLVNALWTDLARLKEASLPHATPEEAEQIWTEIVDLHGRMKDPPWEVLGERLAMAPAGLAPAAVDRLKAQVQTAIRARDDAALRAAKPPPTSFSMPLWVVFLVAMVIGVGLAAIALLKAG